MEKINASDVTIVIPAYNHEKYIEKTLHSAANLISEVPIQIYVIDDASSDNTFQVAQNFFQNFSSKFASHKLVRKDINKGIADSLNRAINDINTKYVYMLASDDIFLPDSLQNLFMEFRKEPNLALVVGNNYLIDEQGQRIKVPIPIHIGKENQTDNFIGMHTYNRPNFSIEQAGTYASFLIGNYLPVAWLANREMLLEVGGFSFGRRMEDWSMLLKLTKRFKVKLISQFTAEYRTHPSNSVPKSKSAFLFEHIITYLEEYDYAHKNGFTKTWIFGLWNVNGDIKNQEDFFDYFIENVHTLKGKPHLQEVLNRIFFQRELALENQNLLEVVMNLIRYIAGKVGILPFLKRLKKLAFKLKNNMGA